MLSFNLINNLEAAAALLKIFMESTFKNNGCWYYSGYNNYFSFLFACRILLIKTGRRWPYIICIFISGTAFLLMLPFERGVYPSDWPIVVMAMIGNLFVSTTFAMIWMYTPELFPTNIRWKLYFRFCLTFTHCVLLEHYYSVMIWQKILFYQNR